MIYGKNKLGILPGQFSSLGYTLWEWLNPEQHAAEYEAIGKEAPPPVEFGDVIGAATEDARELASAAKAELYGGAQKIVIAAAVGVGIWLAIMATQKRRRK
jgi:hypothetical protein